MSQLQYIVPGTSHGVRQYAELHSVSVSGVISDAAARYHLVQNYVNPLEDAIEAVYTLPLGEGVAVASFEAEVDGKKIVTGSVREKVAATKGYEEAMKSGKVVAKLLDPERPDRFQAAVGSIPASKTISIRISLTVEITPGADANQVRFVLPTDIAPLFQDQDGLAISAVINGPKLSVNMICSMSKPITSIHSPSHSTIQVHRSTSSTRSTVTTESSTSAPISLLRNRARVSLTADSLLQSDLVITIKLLGLAQPRVLIEQHPTDGTHAISLTFSLRFLLQSLPTTEIVFLVDRSGSMSIEHRIKSASEALELLVKSIPAGGHYFNIVGFGGTGNQEFLFPEGSLQYSEQTVDKGTACARDLKANLGGTDIIKPYNMVIDRRRPGVPLLVFLLTDGEIENSDRLVQRISQDVAKGERENAHLRVYSFGIGSAVDRSLIIETATVGSGKYEFVRDGEPMQKKVVNMLKAALMPLVTNVWVQWSESLQVVDSNTLQPDNWDTRPLFPKEDSAINLPVEQAPFNIPSLVADVSYTIYCILPPTTPLPKELVLQGSSANGPVAHKFSVGDCLEKGQTLIHSLAARALVRDLEAGSSCIHAALGRFTPPAGQQVLVKGLGVDPEKIKLSTTLSREKVEECFKQKIIDIAVKYNFSSKYTNWVAFGEKSHQPIIYDKCEYPAPARPRVEQPLPPPPTSSPTARADLATLLKNQSYDGSFPLVPAIARVFSTNVEAVKKQLAFLREQSALISVPESELETAWATRAAVDFMKNKLGDLKEEWDLLAEKAESSVGASLKPYPEEISATIKEAAENVVQGAPIVDPPPPAGPSQQELESCDPRLRPFLEHQDSHGLLPLIPDIAAAFKTTLQNLKEKLSSLRKKLPEVELLESEWEKLWATSLGAEFMKTKLPDLEQEWKPLVEKAEKIVESMLLNDASDVSILTQAAKSTIDRRLIMSHVRLIGFLKQVVAIIFKWLTSLLGWNIVVRNADASETAMEGRRGGKTLAGVNDATIGVLNAHSTVGTVSQRWTLRCTMEGLKSKIPPIVFALAIIYASVVAISWMIVRFQATVERFQATVERFQATVECFHVCIKNA